MDWIGLYLEEDLGAGGDITSAALLPPDAVGQARVVAREPFFLAGLPHALEVFRRLGCRAEAVAREASWVEAGAVLADVSGPARGILAGERLALNLLGRMGGVATAARRAVEALEQAGAACRVAATRKTTPGFRFFEKEAVSAAGGERHRMGLFDAAMVKDNHLEAVGGDVAAAVAAVRRAWPALEVTVEAESLEDALAAARAGAHWVMVDNQDPATGREWAGAVRREHPGARVEASGGIHPEEVVRYAWADRVSLGALTLKAPGVDVALDWGAAP